jgi:hypothetical protein
MKNHDLIFLGILAAAIYVWAKMQPIASVAVAPGSAGTGGALLTLPPGVPSGQAAINIALGYNADGSVILNPLDAGNANNYLPSTAIGIGTVDLAPNQQPSMSFDDGLVGDSSDQGGLGLDTSGNLSSTPLPGLNVYA